MKTQITARRRSIVASRDLLARLWSLGGTRKRRGKRGIEVALGVRGDGFAEGLAASRAWMAMAGEWLFWVTDDCDAPSTYFHRTVMVFDRLTMLF